jgi:hypothetical protein
MLFSISNLKNSFDNLKNKYVGSGTERYRHSSRRNNYNRDPGIFVIITTFILAIIFFIIEMTLLYYALTIAVVCGKGKTSHEKTIHFILAFVVPGPYLMFSIFVNKDVPCIKEYLAVPLKKD